MDPRKRLQVLQQSSPSIRVAAQPVTPIKVAPTLSPQTIQVGNQVVGPTPNRVVQPIAPPQQHNSIVDKAARTFLSSTAKTANTGAEGIHSTIELARALSAHATGNKAAEQAAIRRGLTGQFSEEGQGLGGLGAVVNNETAQHAIAPGTFAKKVVGTGLGVSGEILPFGASKLVKPGAKIAEVIGKEAAVASGLGLAGSVGEQLGDTGHIDAGKTAVDTLIAGATGGIAGGIGHMFSAAKTNKALKKIGIDKTTLKFLKNEDDPDVIAQVINDLTGGTKGSPELFDAIAKSSDTRAIGRALADFPLEAGTASTIAGATSDAVARSKYGVSPLTGETAPVTQLPTPQAPGGHGNPSTMQLNPQEGIQLQSSNYPDMEKEALDIISDPNKQLPATTQTAPNYPTNAGDGFVMSEVAHPKIKSITKELTQINNNLSEIRDGTKAGTREEIAALTKRHDDLVEEAQKPFEALQTAKATPEADVPTAGEPVTTEAQVAAGAEKSQTGVADSAPSEPAAKTEAPSTDTNVDDAINKNADKAVDGKAADNLSPETNDFIQSHINEGLKEANRAANKTLKGYTKQKAARAAAGIKSTEGLTGQARVNALKSNLRGEYDKVAYKGLMPDASHGEKLAMYEKVLNDVQHSNAYKNSSFDTINVDTALEKAFFPDINGSPTKSDIKYLRQALGDGLANKIDEDVEAAKGSWDKVSGVLADLTGAPKGLMASLDFSFGLRQGAKLGARFPKEWAKAQGYAARFIVDPKFMDKTVTGIKEFTDSEGDSIYDGLRKMGLKLNALDDMHEETMAGIQSLRDKGIAKFKPDMTDATRAKVDTWDPLAASDRAYSGAATMQRALTAQSLINKYGGLREMEKKLGPEGLKAMGTVINSSTGAADLGSFEKYAPFLGKTLFSPRLWKSNLDVINPGYYMKLYKKSPAAAGLALQNNAAFGATMGAVIAAAAAVGADINADPTSSDFMKIKVGNTRYDVLGGLQQNVVLASREILNRKTSSETGEQVALSGEDKPAMGADRLSVVLDFLQNKSNPLLGAGATILKGEDRGGNPVNPATTLAKLAVPLNFQSTAETSKDVGSIPKGIAMNIPGTFGISTQTYGTVATKDKGKPQANGLPSFKGKVTDNMVTDNGRVLQDDKGRPITVKIPEGATKAEAQAIKDQKKESALKAEYKRNLSSEDQALLGRSDKELQKYVKDGTIDQAKYDKLQTQRDKLETIGKADDSVTDKHPHIKTEYGKAFISKFDKLSTEQKAEFVKHGKTTPESQAVVDAMNNNPTKPSSVPKLEKGNNQLAMLYTKFEADNEHNGKNYTAIDKQNKAKAFWNDAIKTQYDSVAQDLVSEGNSKDYKALVSEGKITKSQLDQAIQLDNALYQTGWNSLKFAKKFRDEYGYATPSKTSDGKLALDDGSGSSSKASPNAHLDALLSNVSSSSGGAKAPNFSARSRGIKFKGESNYSPKVSRKISINL